MTEKVKIDPIIVNIEENFRWVCGKIKKKRSRNPFRF